MGYLYSDPSTSTRWVPLRICPLSKRSLQLCSFLIRGGKRITPVRFCGYASPKLHRTFRQCASVAPKVLGTRHAEIGAINALSFKSRQPRLLRKTTLVVVRFIEPPPKKKWSGRHQKNRERGCRVGREESGSGEVRLQLATSKPCSECIKVIRALHLKAIIFVDDDNELVSRHPDEVAATVHSGGTRGVMQGRAT